MTHDAMAEKVRQAVSQWATQFEERRIGDSVKRRRRVVLAPPPLAEREAEAPVEPEAKAPEAAPKERPSREGKVRVVSLTVSEQVPAPEPTAAPEAAAPAAEAAGGPTEAATPPESLAPEGEA
ncbi:MAG: hypothetical protein JRI59_10710, partial [Deltaproteobacteria bacterium]|nr:hypothetical protein [Deltaproteobacteria bacterium]